MARASIGMARKSWRLSVKSSDILKKVIAWRCVSILVTMLVLFVATGDVKSATGITVFLHTVLISCHYVFEKLWATRIKDETR